MGKFLVRMTIIFTSVYFLIAFVYAQYYGIDILNDYHSVVFELCVVVYCYSEGKYHCRFLKYTALSILCVDLLSRLDNSLNFLTVSEHNLIPISILALGMGTSTTLAIRHFYKVLKLKNERRKQSITNQEDGISVA